MVLIGSRSMAVFDDVTKKLLVYDQRVDVRNGEAIPVKTDAVELNVPAGEPLRRECEAFLEALVTREPPPTDGREGLRVLRVLQAAQTSLRQAGEAVNLPADEDQAALAD